MLVQAFVAQATIEQFHQIACLKEIAYEQGFISADQARTHGEMFRKTVYGRAILKAVGG